MIQLPYVIMAFVTLQRLAELAISSRNTRLLKARCAVEIGAAHYPVMVALHAGWLIASWLSVGGRPVSLPLLGVFLVLQAGRVWVLATLGARWTTRIIVCAMPRWSRPGRSGSCVILTIASWSRKSRSCRWCSAYIGWRRCSRS